MSDRMQDHAKRAEELLKQAEEPGIGMIADRWVAEAQVHATLALVEAVRKVSGELMWQRGRR